MNNKNWCCPAPGPAKYLKYKLKLIDNYLIEIDIHWIGGYNMKGIIKFSSKNE